MGNTEEVAQQIHALLGEGCEEPREVYACEPEDVVGFDVLLFGIPTWHIGEMQDDWVEFGPRLSGLSLDGVKVGLFGCGDQAGYPSTFGDALGLLWQCLAETGAELIGQTATTGYSFETSKALGEDGRFVGLIVDNDNESDLTDTRVRSWVDAVRASIAH